jgi:hypothetical protein
MSQVSNTTIPLSNQLRQHWIVAVSALLALLATAAVVLVLAIDGGSADTSAQGVQHAARADGGPEESAVAASIGARPIQRPDESATAAAVGSGREPAPTVDRPDESRVAASIYTH